jgi:hypothetical protein
MHEQDEQAQKRAITLETVLAVLEENGIARQNVLNVYLWGSRCFGWNNESSDFDFIAVLEHWDSPDPSLWKALGFENVLRTPLLDVTLLSASYFQQLIDEHTMWALPCLFRPVETVWLDRRSFNFKLELPRLGDAAATNASSNLSRGKGFFFKGQVRRARKRVHYVLQHLDYMVQIAENERIVEWTRSRDWWEQLVGNAMSDALVWLMFRTF